MNDSSSRGVSLNDYVSEGQLFFKPIDKVCFEGALAALCDSHRHVVIVTDDKVIADRYYRYFTTRIAIRENITLDTRAPTGAGDVLNRFNTILSASTVESARSADNNDLHHVMAMVDTSNMSDYEWGVLGRLLKNFPGANIRILAFVSESQLDVIDSVLSEFDDQVYRWILTTPTPEYLEALLEMGEQYNYQSETQQMAAAMGYKRKQLKSDLVDELDALDAHLASLQNNQPIGTVSIETAPEAPKGENDFDADLNALLGAIKKSHGIDDSQQAPTTEENADTQSEPAKTPPDSKAKEPSRRLIWTTGLTGIVLILVALFAPWEQTEVAETQVQLSPRTFSTKAESAPSQQLQQTPSIEAQRSQTQNSSPVSQENADITNPANESLEVAALNSDTVSQTSTEEPLPLENSAQWNDDMARILAAETDGAFGTPEPRADDTQVSEPVTKDEPFEADARVMAESSDADILEQPALIAISKEAANTVSTIETEVSDSAEQIDSEVDSIEAQPPQSQMVASSTTVPTNPTDGRLIIQQASPSTYFIQLGVYANPTQAMLFIDTLPLEAGAFQARLNKSGRELSTVLSGPFESRVDAEAVATSVLGDTDVWIRGAARVKAELGN
jgi:hypothetical protein